MAQAVEEHLGLRAHATVQKLRDGRLTAVDATRACLARIEAREPEIGAWAFLDPDHALAQARGLDEGRRAGRVPAPLFGLPVGVKDIVDTHDMPTENGTPLHAGRRPERDATLVAWLRQAGAVILGKTVTTELAVYTPGRTRNPRDPLRTPGGSSSGSAAAVAAGMVPLAIGSQTNGSVIRPAAYCGVHGYKPTYGLIPRTGVLAQSRPLDTLGVLARSVADLALIAEPLIGFCPGDPDTRPQARPALLEVARQEPPAAPRLAFVRQPVWDQAEAELRDAFEALVARHAAHIAEVELPAAFHEAHTVHQTIMEADLAFSFAPLLERGAERISPRLREMTGRGAATTAVAYHQALAQVPRLQAQLAALLEGFDAILTPATTGVAPKGLESTGSPTFCTIWTLLGVPAVILPLLEGEAGMPIGVQLVGARGDDARLLRTARWFEGMAAGS